MSIAPHQLKIEDAPPRSRSASAQSQPDPPKNPLLVSPLDSALLPGNYPMAMHMGPQYPPFAHYPPQGYPYPMYHGPGGMPPYNSPVPASNLMDDDNPTLFPRTGDWMRNNDNGNRGEDGHNFSQYGPALEAAGYTRILQIADEGRCESSARDLITICEGMPLGIAKLLIKYADKDCITIQRKDSLGRHQ
jgi:hypothetical protein